MGPFNVFSLRIFLQVIRTSTNFFLRISCEVLKYSSGVFSETNVISCRWIYQFLNGSKAERRIQITLWLSECSLSPAE